jgi:hypothetical protein
MDFCMNIVLKLDLTGTTELEVLHNKLANIFGFPAFYGKNYPALVDCLSSLRYPDDGMTQVVLKSNADVVLLEIIGFSTCSKGIISTVLSAVESVNDRLIQNELNPSILLLLTRESRIS